MFIFDTLEVLSEHLIFNSVLLCVTCAISWVVASLRVLQTRCTPVSLSALTSKEPGNMWKEFEIPGLHLTDSTPLSIRGSLFAVGGKIGLCLPFTSIILTLGNG